MPNRKWVIFLKPEIPIIETGSRKCAGWKESKILLCKYYPTFLIFWTGEAPETFEKFSLLCNSIWIYPDKNDYTGYQDWKFKKTKIGLSLQKLASFPMRYVSTSGSDLFNFRFAKNSQLPVRGRKRKSKISRCIISRSTLYILKVSSKSAHGCRRSNFPHLK